MTTSADGLAVGDDAIATAQEAVRAARTALGTEIDLAVVFVAGHAPDAAADALLAAHEELGARTTVGCSAAGVIADGRAVVGEPAVAVWVASLPGTHVRSYHLEVMRTRDAWAVVGMPVRREDDVIGTLLADPWSFPVEGFVSASRTALRALPMVGGMAHGPEGASSTRLMVDGQLHDRGAVGVVLSGLTAHTLVNPGHRPFGAPMTVTASDGPRIQSLAGGRAADRMRQAVDELGADDRALADRGVMMGIAVDEYVDEHGADEMVVRSVLEIDAETGALELPDPVPVGTTVRFCLVDPHAASSYLSDSLVRVRADADAAGTPVEGALVMACTDRYAGARDALDADVRAITQVLGAGGAAGMLSTGEIGPVRGGNYVHGLSSTVLAFAPVPADADAGTAPSGTAV
jgi:small ligand-binding sensory domain FIST